MLILQPKLLGSFCLLLFISLNGGLYIINSTNQHTLLPYKYGS